MVLACWIVHLACCILYLASCLNESSLDLPDINGRVDARPDVHEYVGSQHLHVSSQAVNLNLACSNTLVGGESGTYPR